MGVLRVDLVVASLVLVLLVLAVFVAAAAAFERDATFGGGAPRIGALADALDLAWD